MSPIDPQDLAEMWSEGELHVDYDISVSFSIDWREKGWITQVSNHVVLNLPDEATARLA